jgi:hypothetical protein
MKKIDEYLKHARECRDMARMASNVHKTQLEEMARTWEQLAEARQRKLAKDGSSSGADDAR